MSDQERGMKDTYQGNGEHILFVDPDVSVIEPGKRLIEHLGYRVKACTNSAEALVLIHSIADQPIDCVLCELTMPDIGGIQIANTCRLCRPKTGFLLSSERGDILSADSLRILGISEVVSKPFSAHFLAKALHRALTGYRA
jgi:CheY-like chemotaxis protein